MDTISVSPTVAAPTRHESQTMAELVRCHHEGVRYALRRVLGWSGEEDDLVQEVFVRLLIRLRQPGEVNPGAWVRGVARNLAVDEARRRRPVPAELDRLDRPTQRDPGEALVGSELYDAVLAGLRALPARQSQVLLSHIEKGPRTVPAVAAELEISVHAAESLLARARGAIRARLVSQGVECGRASVGVCAVGAGIVGLLPRLARRIRTVLVAAASGGVLVATVVIPVVGELPSTGAGTRAPATAVAPLSATSPLPAAPAMAAAPEPAPEPPAAVTPAEAAPSASGPARPVVAVQAELSVGAAAAVSASASAGGAAVSAAAQAEPSLAGPRAGAARVGAGVAAGLPRIETGTALGGVLGAVGEGGRRR